jgi:hypothetical protein
LIDGLNGAPEAIRSDAACDEQAVVGVGGRLPPSSERRRLNARTTPQTLAARHGSGDGERDPSMKIEFRSARTWFLSPKRRIVLLPSL